MMTHRALSLMAVALLALPSIDAIAQEKPEPIASFIRRAMPHDWYVKQAKLWREVVDKDHANAAAWYNYFLASRYSGFHGSVDHEAQGELMKRIVTEMEVAIPNTYEYNICRWWNGGNTLELFPYLQKAFELRPDYAQLSDHFIPYYELAGDYEQVKYFSRKWFETRDMPEALLSYNYNVLMSLEKDALLVTAGDLDTFPIWLLQHAKGVRPDVTVMNAGLLGAPEYRERMMREHDIAGDPEITSAPEFYKSIAESNKRRPVYFALTVDLPLIDLIKDDLYTVGLANRYSPKRIDNIALLKKNWEKFRLDYLGLDFYADYSSFGREPSGRLNMNYIVPAYLLYEHYSTAGEHDRAAEMRELALSVGRAGGEEDAVRKYFDGMHDGETADAYVLHGVDDEAEGKDEAWGNLVTVAPNPATTELLVQLPEAVDAELELADLQGNVLRRQALQGSEGKIDVTGLSSGSYVLRVRAGARSAAKSVRIVR